jgi:predicted TIM-barrel fold metal-dependent hydrolase
MARPISALGLTRREALIAAALLPRSAQAKPTPVNFAVPKPACDCHTHIIGDPKQFPFASTRVYTPEPALPKEMAALHRALEIKRVIIVTPSVYGTDNSATLYGISTRGSTARGVAVIDDKSDLDKLAAGGIKGIRINVATGGQTDAQAVRQRISAAILRIKNLNWHLQIFTGAEIIPAIKDLVFASPVPVVFDHFGGIRASKGPDQPGFSDLVELLRAGNAYVKLSGAYRASTQAPDYADVAPFAKGLIAANADRVLWGTDWPHPDTTPSQKISKPLAIDDGRLFNQFPVWCPDPLSRRKILVENPARLYGF